VAKRGGGGARARVAATRWRDEGAGVGGSICRAAATLDVRASHGGLAGDLGSSGAAGDAREEEGRGGKGAARWGQPVRGTVRGHSAGLGWGKRSAQEGGKERRGASARGPSWAER
jgi:hypothetical protein